jgi:hypothetical protein
VLLTCKLAAPTRWFNMVLGTVIPAIITISGGTAKVGLLVFWALSQARSLFISSNHSLLFFAFVLLCHRLYLRLPMCVSPTVLSGQSTRDVLHVILCKVVASPPCVTILLRMGVSLWVSSSSTNGSSLDQPCSIQSRIGFCES